MVGTSSITGVIDFKRDKLDVPAFVERIEYDPNRSAHLALLKYADGERRYIIAPSKIKVGDPVISADQTEMKAGNCMKLVNIPLGTRQGTRISFSIHLCAPGYFPLPHH